MSSIHPVTRERHGNRAWNRAMGFGWARDQRAVVVGRQESMQLMMTLPLGFIRHEDQYQFVVVVGLRSGENLMVGADGRWLGTAVPTALQNYPFRRLRDTEGRDLLGVDEAGLLPSGAEGGTPLFDASGGPGPELAAIFEQLLQGEKQRQQARQITAILDQHGLLEPWDIQIQGDDGTRKVEGLYRINEKKLNELSADELLALRNSGALPLAYSQLLSMQHLHQLARMAETRLRAERAVTNEHGLISFANL